MDYFVEKIPLNCFYCEACHTRNFNPYSRRRTDEKKFCGIENFDLDDIFYDYERLYRPDWCPLKKLPSKRDNSNMVDVRFGFK